MTDLSYNSKAVKQFEKRLAKITGAKYVVATNTGTNALFLALKCHGVKENDRVITSPLTFVATANAISYCGAKPIFYDVDKDGCLAPMKIRHLNISAIVPIWLYGKQPNLKELNNVAELIGCPIIEDAAQALGYWKPINKEYTAILSFNGNKIITTGAGGAILTSNKQIAERAYYLSTTAKNYENGLFYHGEIGYNIRMNGLSAEHGLKELKKLPHYLKHKKPKQRVPFRLLTELPMYKDCMQDDLTNARRWIKENKGFYYEQ